MNTTNITNMRLQAYDKVYNREFIDNICKNINSLISYEYDEINKIIKITTNNTYVCNREDEIENILLKLLPEEYKEFIEPGIFFSILVLNQNYYNILL